MWEELPSIPEPTVTTTYKVVYGTPGNPDNCEHTLSDVSGDLTDDQAQVLFDFLSEYYAARGKELRELRKDVTSTKIDPFRFVPSES